MIVQLNDDTLRIWWEYMDVLGADVTVILCEDQNEERMDTSIKRHSMDVPNRPLARRRSLDKLLNKCYRPFTREERRIIWQAYFAQHRDLRLRPAKVKPAPVVGVGGPHVAREFAAILTSHIGVGGPRQGGAV